MDDVDAFTLLRIRKAADDGPRYSLTLCWSDLGAGKMGVTGSLDGEPPDDWLADELRAMADRIDAGVSWGEPDA